MTFNWIYFQMDFTKSQNLFGIKLPGKQVVLETDDVEK